MFFRIDSFSVVSNHVNVTFNSVPEPGTAVLLAMAAGIAVLRRPRRA
jgi:hypothetical protein